MSHYAVLAPFSVHPAESGSDEPLFYLTAGARRFYVGGTTVRVLEELQRGRSVPEIAERVRASRPGSNEPEAASVERLIREHLVPLGLVGQTDGSGSVPDAPQALSSYIHASITLLPPRAIEVLARALAPLFAPRGAIPLLAGALALHAVFFARLGADWLSPAALVRQTGCLMPSEYLRLYFLLALGTLLHELGHAAAARRYGVRLGRIGLGIYLVFPVLYADVSECWRLARGKRIVINLGGIYFQLLLNAAVIAAMLATGAEGLRPAVLLGLLSMLYSLNPLLRFDGYWVYSDLFRLPNLRSQALSFLRELRSRLRRAGAPEARARLRDFLSASWPLSVYSILCAAFFVYFAFFTASLAVAAGQNVPVLTGTLALQAARASSLPAVLGLLPGLLQLGVHLVLVYALLRPVVRLLHRALLRASLAAPSPA